MVELLGWTRETISRLWAWRYFVAAVLFVVIGPQCSRNWLKEQREWEAAQHNAAEQWAAMQRFLDGFFAWAHDAHERKLEREAAARKDD